MKHVVDSVKAPRVKAMIEMAQSEGGIPFEHLESDGDNWLLNCPNRTLDLKLHDRADMIRKLYPT